MRIRFKAPPRTKQPPLLIFILVLIFPPRIPACEDSVNRSLLCAPSLHRNYTYFSIHLSAFTNFHTFSHFSALFHPKRATFSSAKQRCFCFCCCLRFLLLLPLLLLLPGLLLLPLFLLLLRRRWALFSSSEQKNKKRSFDRGEIFSLATHGSPTVMLHFFTRVLTLPLNMMHLRTPVGLIEHF